MKIGVMINLSPSVDIRAKIAQVKEYGMDCCQISIWRQETYTDENAQIIRESCKEYGVEITALWAGYSGPCEWNFTLGPHTIGLVPACYRGTRYFDLLRASDFAEKIGVSNIATHVGFIPEVSTDPDYMGTLGVLRKIIKYMQEKGQTFLFETGQETPVTMLRMIEDIGMDNVGINFDTANLILYGKANSADALDVFGKYVRNTHCKDGFYPTNGRELGEEVALGYGKANMPEVYRKLKALNYDGPFIIEREITGEKQIADIVAARELLLKIEAEN